MRSVEPSARVRWAVLLSALVGTLGAIFYSPDETPAQPIIERTPERGSQLTPARMAAPFEEDAAADPFGQQEWPAPPVAAPAPSAPPPQTAPDPTPAAAPVAPPLPFRYVGRYSDDSGGVTYLARGDQTLIVRPGDAIDQSYRVVAVDKAKIEFEHVETGTHQMLSIPQPE